MRRSTYNYLCHALAGSPDKWRPLLAVYYLTYACDFRCPKCCDGSGTPYYRLGSPVLSGPDVMRLLSTVRRHSDYLVITGGEPLKHPGLAYVLSHIGGLRFDGVVFTTNGYGVGPHLPAIVSSVQHLVFSIDTLDPEKADRWFGMGPGILSNILREIERAREMAAGRCEIIISSVAMPDNLDDLNAV
ncbi:MAG: radical SAM protein, partial [Myxococcota bacterium]